MFESLHLSNRLYGMLMSMLAVVIQSSMHSQVYLLRPLYIMIGLLY